MPEKTCCRLAELAAIARMDGTVSIGPGQGAGPAQLSLYIDTEHNAVARKVYRHLKDLFSVEGELTVMRQTRLKRRTLYHILAPPSDKIRPMLQSLGILSTNFQILPGIKKDLIRFKCCRHSYLRGAFLASGSVSSPERDYHLELVTASEKLGKDLMLLTNRFHGLKAKLSRRKQSWLIYMKGSDQIADFLTIVGAYRSLLEFENARVMRDMKNQVNRLVNCETFNLGKTADASLRQVNNILLIREHMGLDALDPALEEVARVRLENPDISLKELGEIMNPPVGKSGVNHRMRKIEEIAERIRGLR